MLTILSREDWRNTIDNDNWKGKVWASGDRKTDPQASVSGREAGMFPAMQSNHWAQTRMEDESA